jgi:predicted RNA binding protein YcfA (HicA-like mRNA interferase family)
VVEKALVKIADKILKNPKKVAFEELSRLLEGFGFECRQPKGGSSHYIFRKAGSQPISVPKAKPVNQAYVKQVVKLLNLEEWYEENR